MPLDEKAFKDFLASIYSDEATVVEIAAALKRSRTSLYRYKNGGLPPPVQSHLKAHFLIVCWVAEALEFLANEGYSDETLGNMLVAVIESKKNESE